MEAVAGHLEPSHHRESTCFVGTGAILRGYGLGPAAPSPAVVTLNGVVANAAVAEFLCMVTGLREPFGDEAVIIPRYAAVRHP